MNWRDAARSMSAVPPEAAEDGGADRKSEMGHKQTLLRG